MSHCPRCAELEEEIDALRRELGMLRDDERTAALHQAIREGAKRAGGGTLQAARMVITLYNARGRMISRGAILDAVPPADAVGGDERLPKIVDVWLCRARKALGHDAIETVWGHGLRITAVGRERVAEILGDAA